MSQWHKPALLDTKRINILLGVCLALALYGLFRQQPASPGEASMKNPQAAEVQTLTAKIAQMEAAIEVSAAAQIATEPQQAATAQPMVVPEIPPAAPEAISELPMFVPPPAAHTGLSGQPAAGRPGSTIPEASSMIGSTKPIAARCSNVLGARTKEQVCMAPSADASPPVSRFQNVVNCDNSCPVNSNCFLGLCVCHAGWQGDACGERLQPANPWYTADCPNLESTGKLDLSISMESLGGRQQCHHTTVPNEQGWLPYNAMGTQLPYCAYLCYATPDVGTAIIPTSIWRAAQQAEGNVWAGSGMNGDRYHDHWAGYMDFLCQPRKFGDVIEFGAGPWTQFRGLLFKGNVPDSSVASYTILEPGANDYIARSPKCAYKTGRLQTLKDAKVFHAFPMSVISEPGEVGKDKGKQYDTVVSINVIEHVHNAFQYLTSLYDTLKPGGVLIFHDRYYPNPVFGDRILGRNPFHPIRLSKAVMDWFLSHFDIAFNNCDGIKNIPAWKQRDAHPNYAGEIGYYVIATKKMRHP